jgi:hypothetical protein
MSKNVSIFGGKPHDLISIEEGSTIFQWLPVKQIFVSGTSLMWSLQQILQLDVDIFRS